MVFLIASKQEIHIQIPIKIERCKNRKYYQYYKNITILSHYIPDSIWESDESFDTGDTKKNNKKIYLLSLKRRNFSYDYTKWREYM